MAMDRVTRGIGGDSKNRSIRRFDKREREIEIESTRTKDEENECYVHHDIVVLYYRVCKSNRHHTHYTGAGIRGADGELIKPRKWDALKGLALL